MPAVGVSGNLAVVPVAPHSASRAKQKWKQRLSQDQDTASRRHSQYTLQGTATSARRATIHEFITCGHAEKWYRANCGAGTDDTTNMT